MVITSEGKILNSQLIEKASDLWKRVIDKAEEKYDNQLTSSLVSFADFVPKEFQKRLLSSSAFSKDFIEPITDYFMKLEMTETSCSTLSDLNLIGGKHHSSYLICYLFSIKNMLLMKISKVNMKMI